MSHRVPKAGGRDATLDAVVKEAVRRYKRKVWWADAGDLSQQAWLTALEASATFKPEVWGEEAGEGLYWYAWRAVVVQLRNYLWRQSAPVTAPQRKLGQLAGIVRAPLADIPKTSPAPLADALLDLQQVRDEVRACAFKLDPQLAAAALDREDGRALYWLAQKAAKRHSMRTLHKRG